ncbi:hypothetical protein L596_030414 [Steinernema carpocapsae]|uniref:Uncharacterized protein n=1 Tax=Steinernema carpocapsae TaxID=34508 RepID=A0A4U5LPD2_STECR|nr:hypothetical protein L596_030414 [Steinernema carpocapsae]
MNFEEERSTSPIAMHGRTASTMLPVDGRPRSNTTMSAVSGRRASIGQRVSSLFRSIAGRSHDGNSDDDANSTRSSGFRRQGNESSDAGLPWIPDEDEDLSTTPRCPNQIEIVSAHSEEFGADFVESSVEEGVDAAAECSPAIDRRFSSYKTSSEEEPSTIEYRSRSPSFLYSRGYASSNHSSIKDTPTDTAENSAAAMFLTTPRQSRTNTDDEELLGNEDDEDESDDQLGSFIPSANSQTESEVHKMLFRMNRRRFCSECPQTIISPDSLLMRDHIKMSMNRMRGDDAMGTLTASAAFPRILRRSRSLPSVGPRERRRVRIVDEAEIIEDSEDHHGMSPVESSAQAGLCGLDYLSQHKLIGLLPYLPLIRKCDSDVGIEDLIHELEIYRERYLDASARHHNTLRELGLADRAPGRIYDDMSKLLQGMSYEKQCEVLKTRLILVNQHLMYERCGRLMHGVRNRRIFAKLKHQKNIEEENRELKRQRHIYNSERLRMENLMAKFKREKDEERRKEKERYKDLERLYGDSQRERLNWERRVAELQKQRNIDKEQIEQLKEDLEASRRCHSDAEARLIFSQRRTEDTDRMKTELLNSQKNVQKLKDSIGFTQFDLHHDSAPLDSQPDVKEMEKDEVLKTAENEIKVLKEKIRRLEIEADRSKKVATQSAATAEAKAAEVNELKIEFEKKYRIHKDQYDAAQHKFKTLLTMLAKQESYISDLRIEIEKLSDRPYLTQEPVNIPRRQGPSETSSYDGSFCGSESANHRTFPVDLFRRGDGVKREFSAQDFERRVRMKNNTL